MAVWGTLKWHKTAEAAYRPSLVSSHATHSSVTKLLKVVKLSIGTQSSAGPQSIVGTHSTQSEYGSLSSTGLPLRSYCSLTCRSLTAKQNVESQKRHDLAIFYRVATNICQNATLAKLNFPLKDPRQV